MKSNFANPKLRAELRSLFAQQVHEDVQLRNLSYLKTGGHAPLLLEFSHEHNLIPILSLLQAKGLNYKVLGLGTNILFPDSPLDFIVLKPVLPSKQLLAPAAMPATSNFAASPAQLYKEEGMKTATLHVTAGLALIRALRIAQSHGCLGLEFFLGIPGSVGGAVRMNAGVAEREIKDVFVSARVFLQSQRHIRTLYKKDLRFGYRKSKLKTADIVVSATFRLQQANAAEIQIAKKRNLQKLAERREKQPLAKPSLGSAFKNPPGNYAGKLIEACGLKGRSRGGIAISSKHANFIVNDGSGSAQDAKALLDEVAETVWNRFSIRLATEIVFF